MFAYLLFGNRFALHKLLEFYDVIIAVVSYASSLASVTACTSGLLIVPLKAFGHVKVYDVPDIGLVNPHSECNGGHNYIHLLHQELVLV